jgi:hypothetical protein
MIAISTVIMELMRRGRGIHTEQVNRSPEILHTERRSQGAILK